MSDATRIPDAGELRWLNPDDCKPHPNNPRLQLRDDIVQQIAFQLSADGFQAHHAITVRPCDGAFQIVAGHHRVEAARQAGVDVAAWIVDMDDDTAFMQLVLSNTQGELDPLERGMHALDYVDAYKNGGISAYAARVGVTQASISQLRQAAAVARKYNASNTLIGRSKHLLEIAKADEALWPVLTAAMVDRGWSVKDTKGYIEAVNQFDIPARHAHWLPAERAITAHLDGRFAPRSAARLIAVADQVDAWLAEHGTEDQHGDWHAWLRTAPLDHRQLIAYQQELIAGQFEVVGWHHGNWRDHLDELEDGSVALLLTDPPYGVAYRSNYRNTLHETIAADGTPEEAATELAAMLEGISTKLADNAHLLVFASPRLEHIAADVLEAAGYTVRSRIIWDKQRTSMGDLDRSFAPRHERIVHATRGQARLYKRAPDVIASDRADSSRHPTEKPTDLLATLIEATTAAGELVADPYGGVASTAVAAKNTGRRWWSCELDEKYHASGEERLA